MRRSLSKIMNKKQNTINIKTDVNVAPHQALTYFNFDTYQNGL
jgi:hypothetical protein